MQVKPVSAQPRRPERTDARYRLVRTAVVLIGLFLLPASWIGASETAEIRILGTNDLHAYLRPLHYRYLDEIKPWGRQSREGDYVAKAALQGKLGRHGERGRRDRAPARERNPTAPCCSTRETRGTGRDCRCSTEG